EVGRPRSVPEIARRHPRYALAGRVGGARVHRRSEVGARRDEPGAGPGDRRLRGQDRADARAADGRSVLRGGGNVGAGMRPILTPQESAELDRRSAERGITVETLMENAGAAVARASVGVAGGSYGKRAVVVCGKGNNGGDGLVAARHPLRGGLGVAVAILVDPSELRGAAASSFAGFVEAGGRWSSFDPGRLRRELDRADVAVDAIFGTGFRGEPDGEWRAAIEALAGAVPPVVAVDIPSGVQGDNGAIRGPAVRAARTVTFGALKPGVVFFPGAEHCGDVEVADIGFLPDLVTSDLSLVEGSDVARWLRPRSAESHKREAGYVLVLAGSRAMTGAAILAASSAYRAGAGLVTLAVPQSILPI